MRKRFLFLIPAGALAAALALVPLASRADDDDDDDDDRPATAWRSREGHHREREGHHDREGVGHRGREGHHGREGEGRGRGASLTAAQGDPAWASYQAECGTCHLAYAPSMLPAASWQKLLGGLDAHFGQNAELDEPTRARLGTFLARYAGPATGAAPLRITELSWWRREHDEVDAAVFARKAVGTAANCGACHPGADRGDFDEHGVKIPAK